MAKGIVGVYVNLVKKGMKTMEQVPAELFEQVSAEIKKTVPNSETPSDNIENKETSAKTEAKEADEKKDEKKTESGDSKK